MKRIVSIQDISDIGKCSLTAALPVISAMGIECAVLPTAVLSAHSQFEGFTFRDLYDQRCSLYERYADLTVDIAGLSVQDSLVAASDAVTAWLEENEG